MVLESVPAAPERDAPACKAFAFAIALAATTWSPPPARAQQPPRSRPPPVLPEVAIAAGIALPAGRVEEDADLAGRVRALAPLEIEPGLRLFSFVGVSIRAQYAPGWMASPLRDDGFCLLAEEDGIEPCSVRSRRLGAALTLHLLPHARVDPWASVGFTRERVTFMAELPRLLMDPNMIYFLGHLRAGYSLVGWSLPELRAGADVRVVGPLRLGAMATATWGKYERAEPDCPRQLPCATVAFDPRRWHAWYGAGLRASITWPEQQRRPRH